jgi:glyoxylate/hydroxypyruvate reductase A
VTETDLLSALDEGWIGGAVLDVFDKEPLSEGHAFWAHPKVVITPHVAANSRAEDIAKCFKANYERHTTGKLLENKVDWDNLY